MHNLTMTYRWMLLAMVAALASVTAASIGMAISALIDDALLADLFATAAVLLDLFKYMAWPLALGLLAMRRALCALLMICCALILGGVSAWATYDRLMSSIVTSRAEVKAYQIQRLADLEESRRADAGRIEQLDAEAIAVREQASALRDRGMASRGLELETAALARIDAERERATARRDAASHELTAIHSQPAKGAGLPLELATLLCLGFAVALEIVPALILSALRSAPVGVREQTAKRGLGTVAAEPERIEEQFLAIVTDHVGTAQDKAHSELEGGDADLLQTLLQQVANAGSGTKVAVRKFAREVRIGNERASRILQQAAALGVINKTTAGYVVA